MTSTDPVSGELASLRMIPLRVHQMRLERACEDDAAWLRQTAEHTSRRFGTTVITRPDDLLEVVVPHHGTPPARAGIPAPHSA